MFYVAITSACWSIFLWITVNWWGVVAAIVWSTSEKSNIANQIWTQWFNKVILKWHKTMHFECIAVYCSVLVEGWGCSSVVNKSWSSQTIKKSDVGLEIRIGHSRQTNIFLKWHSTGNIPVLGKPTHKRDQYSQKWF